MGVSGSVAYMFDHTATFGVEGKSADEILETLMEQDVDVRCYRRRWSYNYLCRT